MSDAFVSAFELADDHSGSRARVVREELLGMDTSVRRAMDAGMTPDEMKVAQAARAAVQAAQQVVEALSRSAM